MYGKTNILLLFKTIYLYLILTAVKDFCKSSFYKKHFLINVIHVN